MEMKQNHAFFYDTYSILTPYLSLSKNIKVFHWLLKSIFLCLWLTRAQTMEMEQNQAFFIGHIQKYSSFSMTFKMEVSQFYDWSEPKKRKRNKIRHFFMGYIQIWRHFSLVSILKSFHGFYSWHFSISLPK